MATARALRRWTGGGFSSNAEERFLSVAGGGSGRTPRRAWLCGASSPTRADSRSAEQADGGGGAGLCAGRFGWRAGAAFAARAAAGVWADVHIYLAQLAGCGAGGDARSGDARREVRGDGSGRADPAPSGASVYAGVAGGGAGTAWELRFGSCVALRDAWVM